MEPSDNPEKPVVAEPSAEPATNGVTSAAEITPAPVEPIPPEPMSTPAVDVPIEVAVAPIPAPIATAPKPGFYAGLSREAKWVFWATIISGIWRCIFVGFIHQPWKLDWSDMHNYYAAAQHFADLKRPTDTGDWYYPTGTGMQIAFWMLLFGMKVGQVVAAEWQALLSTAVIPLTYIAGRRFFPDPRVGTWAALLFSIHYLPMGFAGMYMSETYLMIGLALAVALLKPDQWKWCLAAGFALGYGSWAKSQAFMLAPLWAGLIFLTSRNWKSAAAIIAGVAVWVTPISIIASKKAGVPAFISTNGGQTFALGQCPIRSIIYEHPTEHWRIAWSAPDLNQRTPRGEVEASWGDGLFHEPFNHSSYYVKAGLDCIRRYPMNALRNAFMHTADTFSGPPWSNIIPWPDSHAGYAPFSAASNWFIAYFIAPFAFFGLWRYRRSRGMWMVFGLPFLSLWASAVGFHGDPRFREPYDFMFLLAGMSGWFVFRDWYRARQLEKLKALLAAQQAALAAPTSTTP